MVCRLKKIKAEIAREEQKQAEKLEKKLKMEEEKKVLPKKLGRQKYVIFSVSQEFFISEFI